MVKNHYVKKQKKWDLIPFAFLGLKEQFVKML